MSLKKFIYLMFVFSTNVIYSQYSIVNGDKIIRKSIFNDSLEFSDYEYFTNLSNHRFTGVIYDSLPNFIDSTCIFNGKKNKYSKDFIVENGKYKLVTTRYYDYNFLVYKYINRNSVNKCLSIIHYSDDNFKFSITYEINYSNKSVFFRKVDNTTGKKAKQRYKFKTSDEILTFLSKQNIPHFEVCIDMGVHTFEILNDKFVIKNCKF